MARIPRQPLLCCLVVALLALFVSVAPTPAAAQDLVIDALTPPPSDGVNPNTIMATGNSGAFASSLLGTGTPALLWGVVPSSSVTEACQKIVSTGTQTLSAQVTGSSNGGWGDGTFYMELTLLATGGCQSAPDESGTQFLFSIPSGRNIAIVCPPDAGSLGCMVYTTGDDVTQVWDNLVVQSTPPARRLLYDSSSSCMAGIAGSGPGCVGSSIGFAAACGGIVVALSWTGIGAAIGGAVCFAGVETSCFAAVCGAQQASDSGCFPGSAQVLMRNGELRMMHQLQVGDQVATFNRKGKVVYSDIYAFGHKDPVPLSKFIRIKTSTGALELTPLHLVPTFPEGLVESRAVYKRARDVLVGDYVLKLSSNASTVKDASTASLELVTGISRTESLGLYNPITLSGHIIVSGVGASAHSEWFLDDLFEIFNLQGFLHHAYQVLLMPVRMLYRVLGKELYTTLYNRLDQHPMGVAGLGTQLGKPVFAMTISVLVVALAQTLLRNIVKKKEGSPRTSLW